MIAPGQDVLQIVQNTINNIGYGLKSIKLKDLDDITKLSLIENHIISPEFGLHKDEIRMIAINEEENICIMINEEDHLRIQVFGSGIEVENCLNLAIEIDKKIEELLNYAYSEKYGFLTACPTNVGTGLRISSMVHLPRTNKNRKC